MQYDFTIYFGGGDGKLDIPLFLLALSSGTSG